MQRRIELEGCLNFRDLGGYPSEDGRRVRWRAVFRSDALHHLSAADVSHMRDELGIGTIVDLRSTPELTAEGRGALAAEAMRFHHLPLFDGPLTRPEGWAAIDTLADRYTLLAEFAREPIARVVEVVAASDEPLVYHCAAGKDRTGVVSAVLLGLLGVPDDVIVADYAATQENLDAIIERLLATKGYQRMLAALPPDTIQAEAATMVAFLRGIRERYGTMRGYARAAGVRDDVMERLAGRLLEA
ncbi:MAG TPA: tyrosine-protein phosphatase [Candidatus Binatia bacterium]|nr:tyrosine-protein phosphatase [Candidatus Binatia bacterium]